MTWTNAVNILFEKKTFKKTGKYSLKMETTNAKHQTIWNICIKFTYSIKVEDFTPLPKRLRHKWVFGVI